MNKRVILIIILICLMVLSGCNTNSGNRTGTKTNDDNELTIYFPTQKVMIPSDDFISQWEEYMSDKYDMTMNIEYCELNEDKNRITTSKDSKDLRIKLGINMGELVELSDTNGLVYLYRSEDLTELIYNDLIIPVNQYIESIGVLNQLDQDKIDVLSDSSGNIWALPLHSAENTSYRKRTYNKEWLDKAGMQVPETLEEFYKFAKFVATKDPDGNGINDTYIADYRNFGFYDYFEDVFKAFGCYAQGVLPLGYNPHTREFENMILKEEFIEAISYIKLLKDEGLIVNSDLEKREYKVASSFRHTLPYDYVNERTYGYYLKGSNDTLLVEQRHNNHCITVLKYSEEPEKDIELFYNLIYSDKNSAMDLGYGVEGTHYFDKGSYYEVLYNPYETKRADMIDRINIWTSLNRTEYYNKPTVSVARNASDKDITVLKQSHKDTFTANNIARQFEGTDLVYSLSFDEENYLTEELHQNTGFTDARELYTRIMDENADIEAAVMAYAQRYE